ncbi:hypothetical protein ACN47E_004400 [Coniothyrium glycines]
MSTRSATASTPADPDSRPVMHEYPGLGLPLRHNEQNKYGFYPIGAHGSCYGSDSLPIPVREVAMMDIMEKLTDKDNWHKKVFDTTIVEKWKKEALAIPNEMLWKLAIDGKRQYYGEEEGHDVQFFDDSKKWTETEKGIMTETAFDCCIQELQSKARYFEKTGIIPTLDACASVAKSDNLVNKDLHDALVTAFNKLKTDHAASPDWHPRSNKMVQDLVHPSMYPLVYGRTTGFKEECVGVDNAVSQWAGKGSVIPPESIGEGPRNRRGYGVGSGTVPPEYWSNNYQWLPANVAFREDGRVEFTSYVNNLHPERYGSIYRTIEELIQTSLPLWDQCLALASGYEEKEGAGRLEPRYPKPDDPDDETPENWVPSDPAECAECEVSEEDLEDAGYDPDGYEEEGLAEHLAECKWIAVRKPYIPEPTFNDVDYTPKDGHRLVEKFRATGLQVIVKLASIELTPEKPEFPVGGWHVEGQMNEHICATSLYYLDSENITSSSLSFRMQTSAYLNDDKGYDVGQDCYHWMEQFYGTGFGCGNSPCLQNYGSVETKEGRLLTFPNVFQHRVSPFKLIDPTKPGHRRFIALWLVDPTKRIVSTANVPPQQMSWFVDSLLGSTSSARAEALSKLPPELVTLLAKEGLPGVQGSLDGTLPRELMEMVKGYFENNKQGLPMTVEEANEHREKLMKERTAFVKTAESGWQQHSYSFCEH